MRDRINKLVFRIYFNFKKVIYSFFSNNHNVHGKFKAFQPVVFRGKGNITFGKNVRIGVINSPFLYNTYAYIEARTEESKIEFGDNIIMNNSFSITAEKSIVIKNNVLIGLNCTIIDSNFHNLDPMKRKMTDNFPKEVIIGENVFIGNNVTILKGVTVGANSVIGANSLVTKPIPENVIVSGNPAEIVGKL